MLKPSIKTLLIGLNVQQNEMEKAAGCYARAMALKRDYQPAAEGFKRVGGDPQKTYKDYN